MHHSALYQLAGELIPPSYFDVRNVKGLLFLGKGAMDISGHLLVRGFDRGQSKMLRIGI